MNTEDMIRELENVAKEFRNKPVYTGETSIPIMCKAIVRKLKELDEKTKWHIGTPTEKGWYVCKLNGTNLYETNSFGGNDWDESLFEKWMFIAEFE